MSPFFSDTSDESLARERITGCDKGNNQRPLCGKTVTGDSKSFATSNSGPVKLATWNVNSIRSRLPLILQFCDEVEPTVLCMQETKCADGQFPVEPFTERGYSVATHGRRGGRGGVAIASKAEMTDIAYGFGGNPTPPFNEPRLLAVTVGELRIATLYAPNGKRVRTPEYELKLAWFELLAVQLSLEVEEFPRLVVAGDFNVCPAPIDVYDYNKKRNANLVSRPEQAAVARLLDTGFIDVARTLHPEDPGFSWYAYSYDRFAKGLGYRLDLVLASNGLASEFTSCRSLTDWRKPELSPSDHTPVLATMAD